MLAQQRAWEKIVEDFNREIDENSLNSFIKSANKDVEWDANLSIMIAGLQLASLGVKSGFDALAEIGIKGSLEQIEKKIKGRITNHELRKRKSVENKGDEVDFYVLMAKLGRDGYNVYSEMKLPEWCGILKDKKELNKLENGRGNNKKK
jgi:hypothetical protein